MRSLWLSRLSGRQNPIKEDRSIIMPNKAKWTRKYRERYKDICAQDQYRPDDQYIEAVANISYLHNCNNGKDEVDPIEQAGKDYGDLVLMRKDKGKGSA
jgi:hypothetical protein